MRSTLKLLGAGCLAFTLALAGCGKSDVGESCSDKGQTSECVDNAICDDSSGSTICLKICTSNADCAATENCTGVTGSTTKACKAI